MAARSAAKRREDDGGSGGPGTAELMAGLGLAIEHRPLAALVPYARNARTHSEEQVALIAGSIREFGFVNPVLVDGENGIIAGHGRVMAARKLGLATVPVTELGLTPSARTRLDARGGIAAPEPPQVIFVTRYDEKPAEDLSGRGPVVIDPGL